SGVVLSSWVITQLKVGPIRPACSGGSRSTDSSVGRHARPHRGLAARQIPAETLRRCCRLRVRSSSILTERYQNDITLTSPLRGGWTMIRERELAARPGL